jgi:RNA polymerase sigma factor (sigma-70 family)
VASPCDDVSGPSERELDLLMARLADGDRGAFEPLFAALHPRAVGLARMSLGASDADDAAQQTLLRVFARASEFTPGRAVIPWFYAIAANEIHTVGRRRARSNLREGRVEGAEQIAATDDAEAELIRNELRGSVQAAVDTLDDESARAIRTLLGQEDRPEAMPPALRKRVSRAYARLRIILGARS